MHILSTGEKFSFSLSGVLKGMEFAKEWVSAQTTDGGILDFDEEQVELLTFVGHVAAVSFALYLFLRLIVLRKFSSDFSNRLVSIVHGLVALAYSAYLVKWSQPFAEVGRESSSLEVRSLFPAMP